VGYWKKKKVPSKKSKLTSFLGPCERSTIRRFTASTLGLLNEGNALQKEGFNTNKTHQINSKSRSCHKQGNPERRRDSNPGEKKGKEKKCLKPTRDW